MRNLAPPRFVECDVPFAGEALQAIAALAKARLHDHYVAYEGDEEWAFAGGRYAEITLDRTGAVLAGAALDGVRPIRLPWSDRPLRQVQTLLDRLPHTPWRMYGWAAFELAYAKQGDAASVGDGQLLHLILPHTEVVVRAGSATVRAHDMQTVQAVLSCLQHPVADRIETHYPLDVRASGATEYESAVEEVLADIEARKLDKMILSRQLRLPSDIDFIASFVRGRRANNPARSFLVELPEITAAGFSPEIVVRVDADGRVISQPLAGTRAYTEDRVRNKELEAELRSDPKELYEHAISVKTAYDELLTVCEAGSVSVDEFMAIKQRGTVQHLASRVTGRLAVDRTAWDAFDAVFPAVTASGIPKEAAYHGIRRHEGAPRGMYSGTVLTIDHTGVLDAALVLRAVYRQGPQTWLQAGAGIVGQSTPCREFEETCEKLESVARYLVPAEANRPSWQTRR